MQLGLERDDARNKVKALTLKNNALVIEIHDFKMNEMKVLKPKIEQLTRDLDLQYAKVRVIEKSEAVLKLQLKEEKVKCHAYKDASSIFKELADKQDIKEPWRIGFDYNGYIGKDSKITPFNQKSAEERGISFVLKDSPQPLFKSSIVEPLIDTPLIIKYEHKQDDLEKDKNNEKKDETVTPPEPIKVKGNSWLIKAGLGVNFKKLKFNKPNKFVYSKNKDNRFHSTENYKPVNKIIVEYVDVPTSVSDMPANPIINACHKPCGFDNYMQCAFNVMFACFKNIHAETGNTSPRQHTNHKHVRAKTTTPPRVRKETYVPKSKPEVYMIVIKEVS